MAAFHGNTYKVNRYYGHWWAIENPITGHGLKSVSVHDFTVIAKTVTQHSVSNTHACKCAHKLIKKEIFHFLIFPRQIPFLWIFVTEHCEEANFQHVFWLMFEQCIASKLLSSKFFQRKIMATWMKEEFRLVGTLYTKLLAKADGEVNHEMHKWWFLKWCELFYARISRSNQNRMGLKERRITECRTIFF